MKKDLIDTVMEKEFHALTNAERKELASFCSTEDEYNQMKDVFIGVANMSLEQPKPKVETKERLNELFDATYPKTSPVWYNSLLTVMLPRDKAIHRQPLVQIAAVALVALLVVPFWSSETDVSANRFQASVEQSASRQSTIDEVNTNNEAVTAASSVPDEIDMKTNDVDDASVLIASADPVMAETLAEPTLESSSEASGSTHPDGVFVAVSQPASETPEMFDLLTATF